MTFQSFRTLVRWWATLWLLLLAAPLAAQQAYVFSVTPASGTPIVATLPASTFTCNQVSPPTPSTPPVNPRHIVIDDPANAGKSCVYVDTGTGPLATLPPSPQPYTAAIALSVGGTVSPSTASLDTFLETAGITQPPPAGGPVITSVTPSPFGPAQVIVAGSGFGAVQGTSTVAFNGTVVNQPSWSDTALGVNVPPGWTTGPVVVTVAGVASAPMVYTAPGSTPPPPPPPTCQMATVTVVLSGVTYQLTGCLVAQ